MKSNPVSVTAIIQAKPGNVVALKKELLKLIAPAVKEEGCINYNLHQDNGDPATFVFQENWASRAHLDAHFTTPHLMELPARLEKLTAELPQIIVATKIG